MEIKEENKTFFFSLIQKSPFFASSNSILSGKNKIPFLFILEGHFITLFMLNFNGFAFGKNI